MSCVFAFARSSESSLPVDLRRTEDIAHHIPPARVRSQQFGHTYRLTELFAYGSDRYRKKSAPGMKIEQTIYCFQQYYVAINDTNFVANLIQTIDLCCMWTGKTSINTQILTCRWQFGVALFFNFPLQNT